MNRTQESFSRQSRRKGWHPETSRQREYFAKARASAKRRSASGSSAPTTSLTAAGLVIPNTIVDDNHHMLHQDNSSEYDLDLPRKRRRYDEEKARRENRNQSMPLVPAELLQVSTIHQTSSSRIPESDLNTKRQKLLRKSDWSGVGLQKPLELEFWRPGDPRSGPSSPRGHMATLQGSHIIRPTGFSHRQDETRTPRDRHKNAQDDEIHLRIGTDDYSWDPTENSIKTPVPVRPSGTSILDWSAKCATSVVSNEDSAELSHGSIWYGSGGVSAGSLAEEEYSDTVEGPNPFEGKSPMTGRSRDKGQLARFRGQHSVMPVPFNLYRYLQNQNMEE